MAIIRHTPTEFMTRVGASSYTVTSTGYDPCPDCGSLDFVHPQGTNYTGWCPKCEAHVAVPHWRQGADEEAKRKWNEWQPPPDPNEGWGQHRTYRADHDLFEFEVKVTDREVGTMTRFRVRDDAESIAGIHVGKGTAQAMLGPLACKAAEMWAGALRDTITEQAWDGVVEQVNNVVMFHAKCETDRGALCLGEALFKAWMDS